MTECLGQCNSGQQNCSVNPESEYECVMDNLVGANNFCKTNYEKGSGIKCTDISLPYPDSNPPSCSPPPTDPNSCWMDMDDHENYCKNVSDTDCIENDYCKWQEKTTN